MTANAQSAPQLSVDSGIPLPQEVIDGEARMFDMLYLRVTQGDAAVSASVIQTIDPNGPMKALWIMARVNVERRQRRINFFLKPLRVFGRQPAPTSDTALEELAETLRRKLSQQATETSNQVKQA